LAQRSDPLKALEKHIFRPGTLWRTWGTRPTPVPISGTSPDSATIRWGHRLAGLTGKGPLELRKIRYHSIDPELRWGVRICLNPQSQIFRANVLAPVLSKRDKELLMGS
jgi:hypothetical protein